MGELKGGGESSYALFATFRPFIPDSSVKLHALCVFDTNRMAGGSAVASPTPSQATIGRHHLPAAPPGPAPQAREGVEGLS